MPEGAASGRFAARLESAREEERSSIARELHDQLGQALTALRFEVSQIARKAPDNPELFAQVNAASQLIDSIIGSVQRIATELRPSILDDLGLATAVEWQAQEFQARSGITCTVTRPAGELDCDRLVSTAVFRIFQETLTNVARHAGADAIAVTLIAKPGSVVLEVTDNGNGIAEQKISDPASLGLLGMRERAFQLGGEVTIRGMSGQGTTVTVEMPVRPPKKRARSADVANRAGRRRERSKRP